MIILQVNVYVCVGLLLLLSSCEDPRVPLASGQVMAIADMRLEVQELDWGTAREVLPPVEAHENGAYYWTLHYAPSPEGALRVIFVNEHSQWAQIHESAPETNSEVEAPAPAPVKIETMRVQPRPQNIAEQLQMQEGSMIIILAESIDKESALTYTTEVKRLNTLAQGSGLLPMFSLRRLSAGSQLIYGWNGIHGIQKNHQISDWIEIRTAYTTARWIDLIE